MKYLFLLVCFFSVASVAAQDNEKKGVEFGAELISELQAMDKGNSRSTTSGGACQSMNFVNLLRLSVSVPVCSSVSFEAASISTCMTASESIGEDMQTFSNLDAGNILFALSVLGANWQINDKHSLFVGIRNMNEDYFATPVTSFFTNSSCGIYPTISTNYPIANYPVASVGMHYCYDGGPIKVQASLYNGTGYNRIINRNRSSSSEDDRQDKSVFRFSPKVDGIFGVTELSHTHGDSYYSLGNALYCKDGISATPWFYAEQSLCRNLKLLAGYSHAFASEAECKDFVGLGAHYQQRKCELGMFTDYASFANAREFATELTFKYNATKNIYIQPVLHIISTSVEESKAAVHAITSLRVGISL